VTWAGCARRPPAGCTRCCGLVPGGVREEITAAHAARILEAVQPAGAVALARRELAGDFLEDLRRIDAQMAQAKKKPAAAVTAPGTTLTEVFGAGPVLAAITLAEVLDVSRFCGRDHFAACNGTAPIEVCSGKRKVHRLSRRGSRRHGHAVRMAAITRIRHLHSEGRACYGKKPAGGKTSELALRALKRRISDALGRHLRADARRAAAASASALTGPGGQPGNGSAASAAGLHPAGRLFGKATPGPELTLCPSSRAEPKNPTSRASKRCHEPLDTKTSCC
jgi:transposase